MLVLLLKLGQKSLLLGIMKYQLFGMLGIKQIVVTISFASSGQYLSTFRTIVANTALDAE